MKKIRIELGLALLLAPLLSSAATFVVTNTADVGAGSLRQAMLTANLTAGPDIIQFNIPGAGAHTIAPLSALPAITDPLSIDGTTQPGYAGLPLIELSGGKAGAGANGLWITAGGSSVAGLVINSFGNAGILLQTNGNNFIIGNFIGTDRTGATALGNVVGIQIDRSRSNTIGFTNGPTRNLISGNSSLGLRLHNASQNVVVGNFIGTDLHGTAPLGNGSDGLLLDGTSAANTIGGNSPGEGNVIGANGGNGIYLIGSSSNVVEGNFLGTDVTGTAALWNAFCGVNLYGSPQNTIGGTEPGTRNLISGNLVNGIEMSASGSAGNVVQGNLIGADVTGTKALGNGYAGVYLGDAPNNLIGTAEPAARNLISGNEYGLLFEGLNATGNSVESNYIGVDITGAASLANGVGVLLDGAPANSIGTVDAGNLISGNTGDGINLVGTDAMGNSIEGNLVGTDTVGTHLLGNGGAGISVSNAPSNTIGGPGPASRNIVSGNREGGVFLDGAGTTGNVVQGNYIGTDLTGNAGMGNSQGGIRMNHGSQANTIGGSALGEGNLISANTIGISVGHSNTTLNVIQGNIIGLNASGLALLGSQAIGVVLVSDTHDNLIGGAEPGEGNVISGSQAGIELSGPNTVRNTIQGNLIGTDSTGQVGLSHASGIVIGLSAHSNQIGGSGTGERNVISGNSQGVVLGSGAASNIVQGNFIGTDSTGKSAIPNAQPGIVLASGAHHNQIGGTITGEGNTVAFNASGGVLVVGANTMGNSIRGNAIFSNVGLGIDLAPDGEPFGTITPNDSLDADTGPNLLQNYPVLTNVVYSAGLAIVQGCLRSTPNRTFELDFFSNTRTEPNGVGEGEVYQTLLDSSVPTDASGYGEFTFQISGGFSNQYFTATATDLTTGDTSEFSAGTGGLRITSVRQVGTNVLVSFTTSTGSNYRVDRTSTMSGNPIPWTTVTGAASVAGTGSTVTITDPGAAALPLRFYRARLLP